MKRYHLIQIISYLICLGSILFLFYRYNDLPSTIPLHTNIKGEIDDFGNKYWLILFPTINLAIIVVLSFLLNKPEILNYPVEITEKNKKIMYSKMKVFISLVSLFISIIFSLLLFDSMLVFKISNTIFIFSMILPLFVYLFFKENKK